MVLEICHSLSVVICKVMLIIKTLFHIGKADNQLMLLALAYARMSNYGNVKCC